MSKKHKDNDGSLHENKDLQGLINIDDKLDTSKLINADTFPIASTVKMTNPGQDTKITIENITNIGGQASSKETINSFFNDFSEDKSVDKIEESVKVEVTQTSHDEDQSFKDSIKELKPISIIDVSKKKDDHSKHKLDNPFVDVMNKVSKIVDIKQFTEKVDLDSGIEKALDSLIYVGGGVIAATSITSKALASVGSYIINRK